MCVYITIDMYVQTNICVCVYMYIKIKCICAKNKMRPQAAMAEVPEDAELLFVGHCFARLRERVNR